jgi:phosphoribosylanthranilate isomerase
MIVQIYEIQTPQEAEQVIELGVNNVGSVIISASSWKNETVRDTVRTASALGAASSLIPLYSDPDSVFATLDYYAPDIVHFCEALFPFDNMEKQCLKYIRLQEQIREKFPEIRIMRSIPIPVKGSETEVPFLEIAAFFEPYSDFFLTDTFIESREGLHSDAQPVPGFVGITGKVCDPSKSSELVKKSVIPVILAGGLSPENVFDLAVEIKPYGVDSCTLTNASDENGKPIRFKKDLHRVSAFVNEAKRAAFKMMNP